MTIKEVAATYYVVWCLIDSGMIFSGLAYNGRDEKNGSIKFNKYQNVKEYYTELG